jgi:hypothetical protein
VSRSPGRAGGRLPALLGLAALCVGLVLLAVVVGVFAASRCGDGEARIGRLAVAMDAEKDAPRATPDPASPRRRERRAAVPVRIEIPAIGVRAPVIRLGLNRDRTLAVPKDFGDTGWWSGGPRPGDPGPAVIVGHVDSYTGPAVFYRVGELRPGDAIAVVGADGRRARFRVEGSERYPKADFPTDRVYGRTNGAALRLITCSGTFDHDTGHYLDNTVVFARAA